MAAEKVVVLDYGKCQEINSVTQMDTDEHEPENVQDNSTVNCAANAIMYDQEDLSNDIPRSVAETARTSTRTPTSYYANLGNSYTPPLRAANIGLSEKIRSICRCWTELEGLSTNEQLQRYIHALFCNTVRLTLSKNWDYATPWDCENLRNALARANSRACQALAALLPSPWGDDIIWKVIHGNFVPSAQEAEYELARKEHRDACVHDCTAACMREPRNVPRTRVELLCYAGLKHEALRLCLYYHNCPVLSEESFYGLTAFHLLYVAGTIQHLIDEVDNLTCHDGFHLIQLILLQHKNVHPLAECLMQILLVRDLVGPSPYCCTLALMEMWCSLHVKQGTSLEDVEQEVQKLGSLATKSAHLYLLVDVLYKQYGRRLLPLYLNLYVHALTIDFNNLEYARQVDCRVAIAELETHMSGIYTKLASLLATEEDQGLARECELTAFSLEPTIERLTKLQLYASSYPMQWSYHHVVRLVPCSGECHCSEKGLCRRDSAVPPWFMTHVPSGILDSNLEGVSKQLLQDLCILVEGPRCRWLTWNMPWRNLHEICMHYLTTAREFRACTDDRRVGIEARLKRLGPFDSSAIPVYRKGRNSSMNLDLKECMPGQNERKSATENCNEVSTSTLQGEMQINVSGTSEMKTEPSEINKNNVNGKYDASEICESRVPVMNNTVCSTNFTTKRKLDENVTVPAGCAKNILASLESCQSGLRTNKVEKVELAVTLEDNQERLRLQDNGGTSDLKTVETTQIIQHNGSHLAKKPFVQTQTHLNPSFECSALSESVTSTVHVKCDQHEFSTSISPPRPELCSPSTNATVNPLLPHDRKAVHSFSVDSQFALSQTPHAGVPGSISAPQHNEAVTNKRRCFEALGTLLAQTELSSPLYKPSELPSRQLDVRINGPSEPKNGISSSPSILKSALTSEVPSSASTHVLHSQPSQTSSIIHNECTSVASAAPVHQYSAPLQDHLYGKNMMRPYYPENPSVQTVNQDSAVQSSTPACTMALSGTSQNVSTMVAQQQQASYVRPLNGTANEMLSNLPMSTSHHVTITKPSGTITAGIQNVPHIGFKYVTHPTGNYQQVVSECMPKSGKCALTPGHLNSGLQAVYPNVSATQGIQSSSMLDIIAQGNISKSNSLQTLIKADAVTSQQILQHVIPNLNPMPEQVGQVVLQPSSGTPITLSQQPVQAYILQPKMTPTKLKHTVEVMQVQQVAKAPGISQPDINNEATVVFNILNKSISCASSAFNSSISLAALPSQSSTNVYNVKPFASQQTQVAQNVAPAKLLLQHLSQGPSQNSAVARLPVARVQCPQARAPQPQAGVLLNKCRPQVLCNSRPIHTPSSALQNQVPVAIPVRPPMEIQQGQPSQSAIVLKQSGPRYQQCANQIKAPAPIITSQHAVVTTSAIQPPYTQGNASVAKPSLQESSSIVAVLPSGTSQFQSRLYATPGRQQTRRPFNKPKTDGKPRWTTSYSPHGKMCHHKNGQGKEATVPRGTENANVAKLGSTANITTSSATPNNTAAGSRGSSFKMAGSSPSCPRLSKPVATPVSRTVGTVAGNTDTTSMMSVSEVDTVAVLVSPEFANSFCAQRVSSGTERTAPKLANIAGSGKVSVNMVVPPALSNRPGVIRAPPAVNQAVILSATLTSSADIATIPVVLAPGNIGGSNLKKSPTVTNHKVNEASCLASSASTSATATPVVARVHQKMHSNIDPGSALRITSPSCSKSSNSGPVTTSHLLNAAKCNIQPALTVTVANTVSNPCNGSAPVRKLASQSYTTGSNVGIVSDGIIRSPNKASFNSVFSAALTSKPTVVLDKLDLKARNVPLVKKCISPAILSRSVSKPMPISKLPETDVQKHSSLPLSKPSIVRPAILGKLSSDLQSPPQSQKCLPSLSLAQDVSRRKDLESVQPLPKENLSVQPSSFCSQTTNSKCGPSVNALVSLSKTHLEVSMEKMAVKQSSITVSSSSSKQAADSTPTPSFNQSHHNLLAKMHDDPQKCVCPICDKILSRKSLRVHMTNIHKDYRNIEFEFASKMSADSSSEMEVGVKNCNTDVREHAPVLVKEVIIPCDSMRTAGCTSDSRVKNLWLKHDQEMPSVNSKSASEASIRGQSTDSKSSNDDKSTDSTSSDVPGSPKSQSEEGMDDKEGSPRKEHLLATTSSESGDNYATRGRVSSRNIKPAQKRSCSCCENTSPNSSAKRCRDERLTRSSTSPKKSTHPKSARKTRSSGRSDKSQ